MNDFSDLFSASFSAMEDQKGELCDILGCGSFSFDQSDLFSEVLSVKQAENRELFDSEEYGLFPFDGHGSSDCMPFRDYPLDLRVAQGNDKKSMNDSCTSERMRRERMKSCFSELASLLPQRRNNTKAMLKYVLY